MRDNVELMTVDSDGLAFYLLERTKKQKAIDLG